MRQRVCDHGIYTIEFTRVSKVSGAVHGPFKIVVLGPKGEPEWVKTALLAYQHRDAEQFHNTQFRSISEVGVDYVVEVSGPGAGPRSAFHTRLDMTLQERDFVVVAPRGSAGRAFAELILARRTAKDAFVPAVALAPLKEYEIEFSVFVAPSAH